MLDRELEPERIPLARAPAGCERLQWPSAARVARSAAGVVERDSGGDVTRDAHVEGAVRASREVDEPRVQEGKAYLCRPRPERQLEEARGSGGGRVISRCPNVIVNIASRHAPDTPNP